MICGGLRFERRHKCWSRSCRILTFDWHGTISNKLGRLVAVSFSVKSFARVKNNQPRWRNDVGTPRGTLRVSCTKSSTLRVLRSALTSIFFHRWFFLFRLARRTSLKRRTACIVQIKNRKCYVIFIENWAITGGSFHESIVRNSLVNFSKATFIHFLKNITYTWKREMLGWL